MLLASFNIVTHLWDGLQLDPGTLIRIVLAIIVVLTLLRLFGRASWFAARLVATVLIVLVLLALLSGKPTRLGDLATLRQAAIEAAHELLR